MPDLDLIERNLKFSVMKSYKNKLIPPRLIRFNIYSPIDEGLNKMIVINCTTKVFNGTGWIWIGLKVWSREQCLHQTAGVGGDIGPRPRRPKRPGSRRKEEGRSNSVDSGSSEDPADPRRRSSPMVITASLTIPMSGAFTLNLDDPDIPYIEEAPKQPSAPPRRQRQRSISGCSEGIPSFLTSSDTRKWEHVGEWLRIVVVPGGRHGSDSAVGSSATLSGDQVPSSPPSWASSPPASPDSAVTAVSYIPDQQAVLQRVSFTTSSEVRQVGRSGQAETSRSTGAPYTPSITSIGGAVLRWGNNPPIRQELAGIGSSVLVFERNIWARVRSPSPPLASWNLAQRTVVHSPWYLGYWIALVARLPFFGLARLFHCCSLARFLLYPVFCLSLFFFLFWRLIN